MQKNSRRRAAHNRAAKMARCSFGVRMLEVEPSPVSGKN